MQFDEDGHRLIAHRGARAFAPENTLPAFVKALDLGCRWVELDVHSTRDGHVVVHHDDDLLRCTDAATVFPAASPWRLADFGFAELRMLDAGRGFAAPPTRMPSLDEVLVLAVRTGLRVNIELKPAWRADPLLAERTLARVADAGLVDRVLISSFDSAQLARMRALSTGIAIGLLTDASLPDPVAAMAAIGADALHPNVDDPRCFDDLRAARAAGYRVFPWTCNDPVFMRALLAAGATGVITDMP